MKRTVSAGVGAGGPPARYILRVHHHGTEVRSLQLSNFSQLPALNVSIYDVAKESIVMSQFRLTITSRTLQLQDVADSIIPVPKEQLWAVPSMFVRAEAEGHHRLLIAATHLVDHASVVQPAILSVEITRNNHPVKIHLTSPNLAHVTLRSTILPVIRIIGDCGQFWDRCPPGALTCQLIIPPTDPPVRLPLFIGTVVQGRTGGVDDKAYEFPAMATFPFRLPGPYELVFRLDLGQLPYSCLLSSQEHWLQQRYAFTLDHTKVFGLVLEKSIPDVIVIKPRVSREDPFRQLCQEMTVALVDHHKKVVTDAAGVVKASIQKYQSTSSVFSQNTAPVLEGPAEAEVIQGRATFLNLRVKEKCRGVTGLYQLCLQYGDLLPIRIKFEYFEEPRMLERFPSRPAESSKAVVNVGPSGQRSSSQLQNQILRKRAGSGPGLPTVSSGPGHPTRGATAAVRRSKSVDANGTPSPAQKAVATPQSARLPRDTAPSTSTEAILAKIQERRRGTSNERAPPKVSAGSANRSASLPLRSSSPRCMAQAPPGPSRRSSPNLTARSPSSPPRTHGDRFSSKVMNKSLGVSETALEGPSLRAGPPPKSTAQLNVMAQPSGSPVTQNPLRSFSPVNSDSLLHNIPQVIFHPSNPYYSVSPHEDSEGVTAIQVIQRRSPWDPGHPPVEKGSALSLKQKSVSPMDVISPLSPTTPETNHTSQIPYAQGVVRRLDFPEPQLMVEVQYAMPGTSPYPNAMPLAMPQPAPIQTRIPSRSPSPSLVTGVDGIPANPLPHLQRCGPCVAPAMPVPGFVTEKAPPGPQSDIPKPKVLLQQGLRSSPVPGPILSSTAVTQEPIPLRIDPQTNTTADSPRKKHAAASSELDSEDEELQRLNLPRLVPPERHPLGLTMEQTIGPGMLAPADPTCQEKMQEVQRWVNTLGPDFARIEDAVLSVPNSPAGPRKWQDEAKLCLAAAPESGVSRPQIQSPPRAHPLGQTDSMQPRRVTGVPRPGAEMVRDWDYPRNSSTNFPQPAVATKLPIKTPMTSNPLAVNVITDRDGARDPILTPEQTTHQHEMSITPVPASSGFDSQGPDTVHPKTAKALKSTVSSSLTISQTVGPTATTVLLDESGCRQPADITNPQSHAKVLREMEEQNASMRVAIQRLQQEKAQLEKVLKTVTAEKLKLCHEVQSLTEEVQASRQSHRPGPLHRSALSSPPSQDATPPSAPPARPPPIHCASPGGLQHVKITPLETSRWHTVDQAVQCTLPAFLTLDHTHHDPQPGGEYPQNFEGQTLALQEEVAALRKDKERLQAYLQVVSEEQLHFHTMAEKLQAELADHRKQRVEHQAWAAAQHATLGEQVAALQQQLHTAQMETSALVKERDLLKRQCDMLGNGSVFGHCAHQMTSLLPEASPTELMEMESQLDNALSNVRALLAVRSHF